MMQRSYIIIGAGIIGAATALALVTSGHRGKVIAVTGMQKPAATVGRNVPLASRLADIMRTTPQARGCVPFAKVSKRWSGRESPKPNAPLPVDDLPAVGAVYVAVLHPGITLGPLMGKTIGKDVTGRPDNADAVMVAPYRPDRF